MICWRCSLKVLAERSEQTGLHLGGFNHELDPLLLDQQRSLRHRPFEARKPLFGARGQWSSSRPTTAERAGESPPSDSHSTAAWSAQRKRRSPSRSRPRLHFWLALLGQVDYYLTLHRAVYKITSNCFSSLRHIHAHFCLSLLLIRIFIFCFFLRFLSFLWLCVLFLKRDSVALMMMMMMIAGDKELLEERRNNNCTYSFHLELLLPLYEADAACCCCCGTCVTCVTRRG